jgi:hypothetical protein
MYRYLIACLLLLGCTQAPEEEVRQNKTETIAVLFEDLFECTDNNLSQGSSCQCSGMECTSNIYLEGGYEINPNGFIVLDKDDVLSAANISRATGRDFSFTFSDHAHEDGLVCSGSRLSADERTPLYLVAAYENGKWEVRCTSG